MERFREQPKKTGTILLDLKFDARRYKKIINLKKDVSFEMKKFVEMAVDLISRRL